MRVSNGRARVSEYCKAYDYFWQSNIKNEMFSYFKLFLRHQSFQSLKRETLSMPVNVFVNKR